VQFGAPRELDLERRRDGPYKSYAPRRGYRTARVFLRRNELLGFDSVVEIRQDLPLVEGEGIPDRAQAASASEGR